MAIDWTEDNLPYLKSQLSLGRVVLFAGAGFSYDARNAAHQSPPLGRGLAERLVQHAGLKYNGESLPVVYEAVQKTIGTQSLWHLLRDLYAIDAYDGWYDVVRSITWNRIYTTNVDNLFQVLYRAGSNQQLHTIVCPAPPEERDQLFGKLQCVHLHGHIEQPACGMTFALKEFAHQAIKPNPWYQTLIDDLYRQPVVFVGTLLEESPFHHYVELRDQRDRAAQEFRAKSFLVDPSIGPIRAKTLKDRNIVPIECTAKEFFESLKEHIPLEEVSVPEVRQRVYPHLLFRPEAVKLDEGVNRYFDLIIPSSLPAVHEYLPGVFFLGAEPTWADIKARRDGMRMINNDLLGLAVQSSDGFRCVALHGPAGSGKTTALMRVAHDLSARGNRVYYSKAMERIDLTPICELAQRETRDRVFVMIDVMSRQLGSIDLAKAALRDCKHMTLVLADRSNVYYSRCQAIADLDPVELKMPDLCEEDVSSILERLDHFGFLGALRGKPRREQIQAFMERASKQLLVAMREATSGKGFDAILRSEFGDLLEPAKLAYTICCLAVAAGAPGVYRRHLTPCLGETSFSRASIINDMLRGVLVPANTSGTMLMPRHRLIATWVANEIAPKGVKVDATSAFLKQIASDIVPNEIKRRSPAYLAYRGMINSERLYETFDSDMDVILGVYDELKDYYGTDFLFWLQYAMSYMKIDEFDIAENYLNQSMALYPNSHQTEHHLGMLYLLQAARNPNTVASQERADAGMKLLAGQMRTRGDYDSYPYAAYLTYTLKWYEAASGIISQDEWEKLRRVGQEAQAKYQRDDIIRNAVKEVERKYLLRAVPQGKRDNAVV